MASTTSEARRELRAADPITLRDAFLLGWLIGQGGSASRWDAINATAPREILTDYQGRKSTAVLVQMSGADGGVLFRRGYVRSDYDTDTLHVTPEGYACFGTYPSEDVPCR